MGCLRLTYYEQREVLGKNLFFLEGAVEKNALDEKNRVSSSTYGFNGKEKLDEFANVTGSHLDFGARIYDSRLGRFLSRDPWESKYAWQTPYAYFANSPISQIDWNGFGDPEDEGGDVKTSTGTDSDGDFAVFADKLPEPGSGVLKNNEPSAVDKAATATKNFLSWVSKPLRDFDEFMKSKAGPSTAGGYKMIDPNAGFTDDLPDGLPTSHMDVSGVLAATSTVNRPWFQSKSAGFGVNTSNPTKGQTLPLSGAQLVSDGVTLLSNGNDKTVANNNKQKSVVVLPTVNLDVWDSARNVSDYNNGQTETIYRYYVTIHPGFSKK